MKLKGFSEKVFLDRYALKDDKGTPLETTPEQMWRRVAKAVASIEPKENQKYWEREFYQAMKDFKYIPGGRILSGAGTGYAVTFYNCFVIPSPRDSRGGILETLKNMVEIMSRGGGVGFNLSSLRPRGMRVKKVNGFSSGPLNWAELFSVATRDIIQQGGTRRGALMLMMWDWHPDIEEFITVKQDLTRILGANLSVCVSDTFMKAVEDDADWPLVYPDLDDPEYDEKWDGDLEVWKQMGKKVIVHKVVKARKIWDLIAEAAWRSAEPGVVFMERYNKYYNNWYWARINCTNPCGEEGLPPWGVCNLGSINLSALVKSTDIDKKGKFDFKELRSIVRTGVRLQDDVVEMDPYVFEEIKKTQYEGERRIGLGTLGLGDALIKLHIRYGSPESLQFIEKVYSIIRDEAYKASTEVAKEKGAFKKFDNKKYLQGLFIKQLPEDIRSEIRKHGVRNSLLLMQAPTGSTSLMANTTSGIEPVFEFEFIRKDRMGEHVIRHHLYDEWYKKHEAELKEGKITKPEYFVGANDLSPEDHVRVQGAIQHYVDASISKTVNAPETHTVEDVKRLYTLAYQLGLKGIAYMREGSREGVLYRKEEKKEEKPVETSIADQPVEKPRPMVIHGSTYKVNTPVGTAFVTINSDNEGNPFEVFINVGKAGTDVFAVAESLGRLISLYLRTSARPTIKPVERIQEIVRHLQGIGGGRTLGFGKDRVKSLPDAIAKTLAMHLELSITSKHTNNHAKDKPELVSEIMQPSLVETPAPKTMRLFDICPKCGETTLAHEEGCKKCYGCGYSEC
ncbi:adenosylcobalamin-dependent ribonucleoside-diphosphate reductase [Candidatus Roizmanbacteria bacterium]|nr:adenosylcobalamin-dependent ribonucleoside-diphosphate reductase [Candidatus Roizmanbacteria bacterium]